MNKFFSCPAFSDLVADVFVPLAFTKGFCDCWVEHIVVERSSHALDHLFVEDCVGLENTTNAPELVVSFLLMPFLVSLFARLWLATRRSAAISPSCNYLSRPYGPALGPTLRHTFGFVLDAVILGEHVES